MQLQKYDSGSCHKSKRLLKTSNLSARYDMQSKAKLALVAFDSLGDGLIYLMMADNLQRNGYEVTYYGNLMAQMQAWFPHLKLCPYPALDQFEGALEGYGLVIMSPPSFIRGIMGPELTEKMRNQWLLVCQKAPSSWSMDHTARLKAALPQEKFLALQGLTKCSGSIRFKTSSGASAVSMTLQYMQERMHLAQVSKEVRMQPPAGLQYRRYARRIIISPDSAGPEKKNWSPSRYLALCHALAQRGYIPNIVVAPKNHQLWSTMKGNVFETPLFNAIDELAAYIYESRALIANDSGNGHLASFLGIPVITIYRKRNPLFYWRPDWRAGAVVSPRFTLPWFGGAIWKPFVSQAEILAQLEKMRWQ